MAFIFSSPGKYIQGKGELKNIGRYTSAFGENIFVIINQFLLDKFKADIDENAKNGVNIRYGIFQDECTYGEMERLANEFREAGSNVVVGVGGGKILDTAKGVANYCDARLAIVPTSAAQDAPCSSLSVVYKETGEFDSFMIHKSNPDLVIVDSQVVCEAPARMIAAGMGDGLSTLFEARACIASDVENTAGGKPTKTAQMLGELCYKIIMQDGILAYKSVENKIVTKALENVIEANIFLSGSGAEGTGDAGAHGLYNALTILPQCKKYMHGELVAFGILVQLVLENESTDVVEDILNFNYEVGLPICLEDIGVDQHNREDLKKVAEAAAKDTLTNMPFDVTAEDVYAAMLAANALGKAYKKSKECAGRR